MRLHRFFVGDEIELKHDFWLHDRPMLDQWQKVLRFQTGQEVILFDGKTQDRLYRITELTRDEAHLQLVTELERQVPKKEIYLFWSLLKKDKNDWVLQKCTELGVSHFVPLLAARSEKTGFNEERAQKIIIEAAEQCGRSDIPSVREPMLVATAIDSYKDKIHLLVAEKADSAETGNDTGSVGILIGPEGGWSDEEKELFKQSGVGLMHLHDFTLRAETAAVAAVGKLHP